MRNRFYGQTKFDHGRPAKLGVVLVNLGTPDAPVPAALRRYLGEFLSDPRVVEIPRIIWKIILHGIILRLRPKKSAQAYAKVWTKEGSPLMAYSKELTEQVANRLEQQFPNAITVTLAMRYGNPATSDVLLELHKQGAERLLILPLYPQYSGATTASVGDAVFDSLKAWRWMPELRVMGAYHDDPRYIKALAESIQQHWQKNTRSKKLLMSFHGMPKATLIAGDPYFCHCHKTARLLAESLQLDDSQWEMAFQSRFGKAEWLQPYIANRFLELPKEGCKSLDVVCPGFAVDCVETLEEIKIEGRESFLAAGGETFNYIPALNAQAIHTELQVARILQHAAGWPETTSNNNQTSSTINPHYEAYHENNP